MDQFFARQQRLAALPTDQQEILDDHSAGLLPRVAPPRPAGINRFDIAFQPSASLARQRSEAQREMRPWCDEVRRR